MADPKTRFTTDTMVLRVESGKLVLPAPPSFVKLLPLGTAISGELVLRRRQATDVAKLRRKRGQTVEDKAAYAKLWASARMYAFDLPGNRHAPFVERTRLLEKIVDDQCAQQTRTTKCPLRYIAQHELVDAKDFWRTFNQIISCTGKYKTDGVCFGEGVVLTNPTSKYVPGRANAKTRLKIKKTDDDEARVIGYSGRSLQVAYAGTEFALGGLTNAQRQHIREEFPVDTLVKFRFRSLGTNGVPKEATLIGKRHSDDIIS